MLKSVFRRIKQNPLFSAIYVTGSALSIASAMIVVIYVYVNMADIYPEHDRSNIYEVYGMEPLHKKGYNAVGSGKSGFSPFLADKLKNSITCAEEIATEQQVYQVRNRIIIDPADGSLPFAVVGKYVDVPFFNIFGYEMLYGELFTSNDFDSGYCTVMITDKLATRLFGDPESAVGKSIDVCYDDYLIRGVIREPNFLLQNSYGQIFFPYTIRHDQGRYYSDGMEKISAVAGQLRLWVKVRDGHAADSLQQQVNDVIRATEAMLTQPDDSLILTLDPIRSITAKNFMAEDGHFTLADMLRKYGVIILILLIVPALNLGGLIAGNMESRLPEMGVRKSFGAGRRRLLASVLSENMVLTAAGGILGLAISMLLVWKWREWVFFLDDNIMADAPAGVSLTLTPEMLFAPTVLAVAFVLCLLVNVMAAMIPAWWALRRPIVESLSENK